MSICQHANELWSFELEAFDTEDKEGRAVDVVDVVAVDDVSC